MIKIKNHIYNENEIISINESTENDSISIKFKNDSYFILENATFEDIEWNYGSQEQCYNEETEQFISSLQNKNYKLQDRIKQLEEDNRKLAQDNYYLKEELTNMKLAIKNAEGC